MILDCNKYIWADSILDEIKIDYDNVLITVFTLYCQKKVNIKCIECVGFGQLMIWDKVCIENIWITEIQDFESPMIIKAKEMYGYGEEKYKSVNGPFYELNLKLINNEVFKVICKDIIFEDSPLPEDAPKRIVAY